MGLTEKLLPEADNRNVYTNPPTIEPHLVGLRWALPEERSDDHNPNTKYPRPVAERDGLFSYPHGTTFTGPLVYGRISPPEANEPTPLDAGPLLIVRRRPLP